MLNRAPGKMSSSAAKRRRLVGPDFVAELAALAACANALSACLPAQPSESERDALAALQAACSGLEAAVAGSLEQSLLLRLPSELLVRALSFLDEFLRPGLAQLLHIQELSFLYAVLP